jgi:hypothetical protein
MTIEALTGDIPGKNMLPQIWIRWLRRTLPHFGSSMESCLRIDGRADGKLLCLGSARYLLGSG